MELNNEKKAGMSAKRFADVQRAGEAHSAELRRTVERAREGSEEIRERSEALGAKNDSIELSGAALGEQRAADQAREARLEQLKGAVADGSLFDRDRLAKAAERLLASGS